MTPMCAQLLRALRFGAGAVGAVTGFCYAGGQQFQRSVVRAAEKRGYVSIEPRVLVGAYRAYKYTVVELTSTGRAALAQQENADAPDADTTRPK